MNNIVSWNLPPHILYTPSTILPLIIILTNPDDVQQQYSMIIRLWRNGQVVGEETVTIEGNPYLQLKGGEPAITYGEIAIPITDAVFELVVYDSAGEPVSSTVSQLLSSVPAATQIVGFMPALFGLIMINATIGMI